jgi:hypothetical protein
MKMIRKALSAGVALMALALAIPASAATEYHVICRGGLKGGVSLDSYNDGSGNVEIYFPIERYTGAKSAIKSNGAHLSPGQCSYDNALIPSAIYAISYGTSPHELHFFLDMYGGMSYSDGEDYGGFAFNPTTSDKNLMWLPNVLPGVNNPNKGSIFDSAWVFHFYSTLAPTSRGDWLAIQRTTWSKFPYPGR